MTPFTLSSRASLVLLWVGLVVSDSAAQLLFKAAAVHFVRPSPTFAWIAIVVQSARVWAAVACLLFTFGCWMLILRHATLSRAFPVTALTFIGVIGGSWWFFGETITFGQLLGIAFIVGGVAAMKPSRT
jgi:drug/metabolite transporter (DMT)-like permease